MKKVKYRSKRIRTSDSEYTSAEEFNTSYPDLEFIEFVKD